MDAPKEIFLKDYKKPDYYFDKVTTSFSNCFLAQLSASEHLLVKKLLSAVTYVPLAVWSPVFVGIAVVLDINTVSNITFEALTITVNKYIGTSCD